MNRVPQSRDEGDGLFGERVGREDDAELRAGLPLLFALDRVAEGGAHGLDVAAGRDDHARRCGEPGREVLGEEFLAHDGLRIASELLLLRQRRVKPRQSQSEDGEHQ